MAVIGQAEHVKAVVCSAEAPAEVNNDSILVANRLCACSHSIYISCILRGIGERSKEPRKRPRPSDAQSEPAAPWRVSTDLNMS